MIFKFFARLFGCGKQNNFSKPCSVKLSIPIIDRKGYCEIRTTTQKCDQWKRERSAQLAVEMKMFQKRTSQNNSMNLN